MATKGRKPETYVYVIERDGVPLYVGKGTKYRCNVSAKKHGGVARILERFDSDCDAFAAERRYIAELMPTENKCPGGSGGRCVPKPETAEERRNRLAFERECAEIERVGSRRYAARFLMSRLSLDNCERYGVSKVDWFRLREVANGCRV